MNDISLCTLNFGYSTKVISELGRSVRKGQVRLSQNIIFLPIYKWFLSLSKFGWFSKTLDFSQEFRNINYYTFI